MPLFASGPSVQVGGVDADRTLFGVDIYRFEWISVDPSYGQKHGGAIARGGGFDL